MNIQGKKILLTGASGGIGEAIANQLASAGATLILTGRNLHRLQELQQQLGAQHTIIAADLADARDRQKLFDACQAQGGIDLLINNAGISELKLFEQQAPERIEQTLHTNLLSPMLLCQLFIPMLRERPEAAIINVGSTFGSIGYAGFSGYCASKFGLRGFTEALRRELADSAIRIIYLAPRATRTEINSSAVVQMNEQLGNTMDDPQQVARTLLAIVQKNQSVGFIGWPEKLFVRLNALLPRLVDKALHKQLPIIKHFAHQ